MKLSKGIKKLVGKVIPSPIVIDFEKGGSTKIEQVAPYGDKVFWDASVPIHKTKGSVEYVRTPDDRFDNLPEYNFEPNFVEIDSLRMHYIDEGPKDGQVILMLHGQPVWSFLYRKMINKLAPLGYRCIAPCMIGMGKSDKPIKEKYHTYDKHCENTLTFIKALGLTDITAFIQDWGSAIGTRVIGENPELFARVILANGDLTLMTAETNPIYIPNPLIVNPEIGTFRDIAKYWLKGLPYSFQAWVLFCLQHTKNFVGGIMQESTVNKLTESEIRAYEAPFPSFIYMAGPRTLPSMTVGIRGQQLGAWESLKKFEKPFLSLIGLKDTLLGLPRIQEKWINSVPGAKGQDHEQFDNANHFIQEDIGETMADRTHKFIVKNPI